MTAAGVVLLGILTASASPTAQLERLDSIAEDLFDQARAADWTRADKTFDRLRAECARQAAPACTGTDGAHALNTMDTALKARQSQQAMQGANDFSLLLVPAIDQAAGNTGVAALDPAVRQLMIDVHDSAAVKRDLDALSAMTDKLRCDPKPVRRFRKRVGDAERAASSGEVAARLLEALDQGVDQLEATCLPTSADR